MKQYVTLFFRGKKVNQSGANFTNISTFCLRLVRILEAGAAVPRHLLKTVKGIDPFFPKTAAVVLEQAMIRRCF